MTPDMQQILSSDVTADEIKIAMFQIGPTKAPRPDDMNALFYQKFWHIIGDNVINAVLYYLQSGVMGPDINHTNIVLIPKIKSLERMSNFRPISLCNVIYKIISKVLINRLKRILLSVISPTQNAFVPGRLFTDNVLVAYEVLHSMHSWKKEKIGLLALKLDISKAYDRVQWDFLQGIMIKLGFLDKWIQWVIGCVTTPSFSILINGKEYAISSHLEESSKGFPFLHICSYYVQKVLLHYWRKQSWMFVSEELLYVEGHLEYQL